MTGPGVDLILSGASLVLTCVPTDSDPVGRRDGVVVAIVGEKIAAVAPMSEVEQMFDCSGAQTLDVKNRIIAPGFVDCHTHLVFGGSRSREYAARLTRSSQEVTDLGIPTGIQATVDVTRKMSPQDLYENALLHLKQMFNYGTTTVESKSGYGLNTAKEIELLQVNQKLQGSQPVDIVSTFLGAHDFPLEISREDYLDTLIHEMIPLVAWTHLAEFCDVYCDEGYYSVAQSRLILETGLRFGLKPKIHVDAYSNKGGSSMAAALGAVSADHLNYTTRQEMVLLREAGVVGVVMPGLDFSVRHPQPFNARQMMTEGLILGLATDLCPGCWMESMQLVMQLACRLYQFSPEEALYAATAGAARAVGLFADRGSLEPGKLADIQMWDLPTFEDLIYRLGNNAVDMVVKRGCVYRQGERIERLSP